MIVLQTLFPCRSRILQTSLACFERALFLNVPIRHLFLYVIPIVQYVTFNVNKIMQICIDTAYITFCFRTPKPPNTMILQKSKNL